MASVPPVVVITGASSGIGRATALLFASKGASVVLASRREQALNEVAGECVLVGGDVLVVPTDVTDYKAVRRLAKATVKKFGRIDVWINGAGVGAFGSFLDVPLDDVRRVLDVNVMGYVYGARAALKVMVEQGEGSIVNIASLVGEVQQPYTSAYGMSKAAVRALGVSLRQELALDGHRKIHVSTIVPPTIDTPFFRHAANYTGREVVAMPPVYPAELVATAIEKVSRSPKPEVIVGTLGKVFSHEHRRRPALVEAQMAVQTDRLQLSNRHDAEDTTGSLFTPAPTDDAAIVGGYDGARRTTLRRSIAWTLGAGVAALVASQLAKNTRR